MRRGYSTITPAVVHALTRRTLERALGWTDYKRSVTHPVARPGAVDRGHHPHVVRGSDPVLRVLPRDRATGDARQPGFQDQLTARLVDALHQVAGFTPGPEAGGRVPSMCITSPLWGSQHPGIIGGPKKAGTSFFTRTPPGY
ncbi:hypothetical protein J8F10_13765 [Gemmata sp. G18]|uniref:Uncharacterized protein n=1 Tax=Gemmata palustris TaxID=2822762 RepID=A0ABS5BRJ8_9BACT|nr:hypothetical protein [Gemmata palustris]MBP3956350.1 hypothetical protein [Gemmata palustris]